MSKKKTSAKSPQKKEEQAKVAQAISKSEEFLNKYKKHIIYTVAGIVILLALVFGYMKLIRAVSYTHLRAHETPEHLV